jgi:hypothetical protein
VELKEIDAALDGAKDRWDHADAPYNPDMLALIRAAEAMREQLYGQRRTEAGQRLSAAVEAVAWARNSGDGSVSLADVDELVEAASVIAGQP